MPHLTTLRDLPRNRHFRDPRHIDRDACDLHSASTITPDSGQPLERAMTTISYHFESPIRTVLNAGSVSPKEAMQTLSREEMEERRWQLEWERRNVED